MKFNWRDQATLNVLHHVTHFERGVITHNEMQPEWWRAVGLAFSREHEAYFRQFLAESLKASLQDGTVKMRGARRVKAFEEALEPVRSAMKWSNFEDLILRLAMTTGMEQFVILEDILRVDQSKGYRLQEGLVDALLDKFLP